MRFSFGIDRSEFEVLADDLRQKAFAQVRRQPVGIWEPGGTQPAFQPIRAWMDHILGDELEAHGFVTRGWQPLLIRLNRVEIIGKDEVFEKRFPPAGLDDLIDDLED